MTEWERKNPGSIEYTCEYCGIYKASRPRCNRCEAEKAGKIRFDMTAEDYANHEERDRNIGR